MVSVCAKRCRGPDEGVVVLEYWLQRLLAERLSRRTKELAECASKTSILIDEKFWCADKAAYYEVAGRYWTNKMDKFHVPEGERHCAPLLAADLRAKRSCRGRAEPS